MSIGPVTPKPPPPPPPPKTDTKPAEKKPAQATTASQPPAETRTPAPAAPKDDFKASNAPAATARPAGQTTPTAAKPTAPQQGVSGTKTATVKPRPSDEEVAAQSKPVAPQGPAAPQLTSGSASASAANTLVAKNTVRGAAPAPGAVPAPGTGTPNALKPGVDALRSALTQTAQKVQAAARTAQTEQAAEAAAAEVASPQGPPKQQTVSGEDRARQEVEVQTVAKNRDDTLAAQRQLGTETNNRADHLFSLADGQTLPKGLTVTQNGNEAVLERRNAQGELLERTVATKGDNGAASLDTSVYKDGTLSRDRVEMGNDGSSRVQHAAYQSATNDVAAPKSFDDLGNSRDAGITYSDNQVHTENGQLHLDEYQQKGDGSVTSSRTSFATQQGLKYIDDKLKPLFGSDGDRNTTDRSDTYSYSIPAPGADGSQGDPTFTHTASYSQGSNQVTSVVQRDLDGHKQYAGTGNHTRQDVETVRDQYGKDGGENYDADDGTKAGKTPKTWLAEYQKDANTAQTQTFIEGSPDNTLVTTKTRDGNTVHEDYEGKALKPDAQSSKDLADVKGTSTRTYAEDGSISAMESQRHEANGSDVHQSYTSSRTATAQGLQLSEHQETQVTQDDKTSSSVQDTTSLLSGQGAQLTSAHSEVTDADGRKATHELGPNGEKLSLTDAAGANARDINRPEDVANDATGQALLSQASVSTASTLQDYAGNGGAKALSTLQGLSDDANRLPGKAAQVLGSGVLNDTLKAARAGSNALGGVAGAVAGGMQLADGIRQHNLPEIFKGLADTASGAKNLYDAGVAGKEFLDSIRGAKPGSEAQAAGTAAEAAEDAGKWAGTAAPKVGGSVVSGALDAVKGMGGIGNVAGAALSTGLGIADIVQGAKNHDAGQIAKGAVGIAGGIGGAIAVAAVGGPLGMAIGAGVGLLVWGIDKLIDRIEDKEHQISHLKIGPPPEPPSYDDIIPMGGFAF